MKLTRRDALLAAGAAVGIGGAGIAVSTREREVDGREELTEADVETLTAMADVIYPAAIVTTDEFAQTYAASVHITRRRGITKAIDDLNRVVRAAHNRPFASFDVDGRDALLRKIGVDRVEPNAHGTVPERVRSYLVNGLLFALFTTPTGGDLLNIQNPLGYPGGYLLGLRDISA